MKPNPPTLPGVTEKTITSKRITTRVLFTGSDDSIPVLFLHGNASSATYWEETMLALPDGYRGIAPDHRGYGGADPDMKIDATRGMRDLSEDAAALLDELDIDRAHLVGHSMGGSVFFQFMIDYPERAISVTLAAPGSPFGFGGTKDMQGTMCYEDSAGSGGGIVNRKLIQSIAVGERGIDDPQSSPRMTMNSFHWKPPFKPGREEELLTARMSIHIGERDYPGDMTPSANWPNVAPGVWGPANALSPKYTGDVSRLYRISPKPPVLWIRGADDQIVSDQSLFDMGTLGALGAVPGWPGADVFPSQPMISQIRYVLNQYQANGGQYQEVVFDNCGHTPYIEKPEEFNRLLHKHLEASK
jgi:pimeloyl-ACP methyl ester carboxylesterase